MRVLLLILYLLAGKALAVPTAYAPGDRSSYVQLLDAPCASPELVADLKAKGAEAPARKAVVVTRGEQEDGCWAGHTEPTPHIDIETPLYSIALGITQFTDEPLKPTPKKGMEIKQ